MTTTPGYRTVSLLHGRLPGREARGLPDPRPVEEPVGAAEVAVIVGVEARTEAVQETRGAEGGGSWSGGAGFPKRGLGIPQEDVEDGATSAAVGPFSSLRRIPTVGNQA